MATVKTPKGQNEGDIELGRISIQTEREILEGECSSQVRAADETESNTNGRLPLFREDRELSVGLYKAALNGDWEKAEGLLRDKGLFSNDSPDRETLRASITMAHDTALHVAAGARQTKFVEKLIGLMEPDDFNLPDENGNTAFYLAAAAGAKSIAEIMIRKNPELPTVRGNNGLTPLHVAAMFGQDDMVRFLHPLTKEILETKDQTELFSLYIGIGLFDLALDLVKWDSSKLAVDDYEKALCKLARKPSAFASKNPGIWKTLIKSYTTSKHRRELNQTDSAVELVRFLWKQVIVTRYDSEVPQIIENHRVLLFEAAELGNFKFLAELFCLYPPLIWEKNEEGQTIFHIAVLHRHKNIFSQIHKIGSIKDNIESSTDRSENTILHLAAILPHPSRLNVIPGAALQLQRELIWFQEVEKIVQPSSREKKNSERLTPRELFTEQHANLLKEGEKWMKDKARSGIVIATIITTIVFAAAFSQPAGNNDIEGTPNHLEENRFQVFAVSDAIAFSLSLFSTLVFSSILSTQYTENAFLKLLPYKLMAGQLTLIVSMIAMMITFTSAFVVTHNHKTRWGLMLFSVMANLPVTALIVSQLSSLFFDIFKSTFLFKSLFQPSKPMIC